MENSKSKVIFISVVIVLLIVAVFAGATYAYFAWSVSTSSSGVNGDTYSFDVTANVINKKLSSALIPFSDEEIGRAISKSNPCVDSKGYDICNLYEIDVVNTGSNSENLSGYIETISSTYTTSNLKYQVYSFSNSLYSPVTDVMVLSHESNSKVYFMKDSANVSLSIPISSASKPSVYYLVVWVGATNSLQDDEGKVFNGLIGFESLRGDVVTASFGA